MLKVVIYSIVFIITIWSMEGLDLNKLFKQSRVLQARILYLFFAISISYLVSNFIYDFINIY